MTIETKPIEEIVNGERKFAGLIVGMKHNGKGVAWRVPRNMNERDIVEVTRALNKMVQTLAKQFPELGEKSISATEVINKSLKKYKTPKKDGKGIQPPTP